MITRLILICIVQVITIVDGQTGIEGLSNDIYDFEQDVLMTWFPLSSRDNASNMKACDKSVTGFRIQVDDKLYLDGSNVTLNWTTDTGCDVILSWMYDSSRVIQEWFNGNIMSGAQTIYFQSPGKTNISVFARNYVVNNSNIHSSTESFTLLLEIYSLEEFYVEYNRYISTNLQTFVVGVRQANVSVNKDIHLRWDWGDNSIVQMNNFTDQLFSHSYAGLGVFEGNLTVTWNQKARVIPFVFHRGELEYKVGQTNGNINLTEFNFTVIGLQRLQPNLILVATDGEGWLSENKVQNEDVSLFKHVFQTQGIYQVQFRAMYQLSLVEESMIGLQIIVDNPVTNLVIEANNPVRYPPALLTLNISVPQDHLLVHNMNCVLNMDDFIDWESYNVSATLVSSELKLTFTYTYLTLGVHNIKISCSTLSSHYKTDYKIIVYNDCFSKSGTFDYTYSHEETAMNVCLDFNTEIGARKDILCLDETPIYEWSIEQHIRNGSYVLVNKTLDEQGDFHINANQFLEGLYRLNLNISFPSLQFVWYQEYTYIMLVKLPVQDYIDIVPKIRCIHNCFERVATRHILHVQCSDASIPRKLKWTLEMVNKTQNFNFENFEEITHYGIHNKSLIIRGGSLTPGMKYQINLYDENLNYKIADYIFTTNLPPFGGSCEVNPPLGFAGETLYTITCSSWIDDNNYCLYYQYLLQGGDNQTAEQVLYVGYESSSISMYLPVGNKDNLYESDKYILYQSIIKVRITDSFGDYTEVLLSVSTLPSETVKGIKNGLLSFHTVSSYLNATFRNLTVSNASSENSKTLRHIQSISSIIALIPLPYQGIRLKPAEISLIGFTRNELNQEVQYDWKAYWQDFLKPSDLSQQELLTTKISSLSTITREVCRKIVSTRIAGTYTISSLTSTMADLISGLDYVTEEVLLQVLECADTLNTNLAIIAVSPLHSLQNHENITLAAEGMVRLVSRILDVVYPTLTPYIPKNPTTQVMRNFLEYMKTFNDDEKYENISILLQEQTFIAMKELRRLELEKERKTKTALKILHGWRKLLTETTTTLDALSGLNHPEIVYGHGLTVMSTNHWIWSLPKEEIRVDELVLNFSGSILGNYTDDIINISTIVFKQNPFYWGLFGEKISSRVVEFIFHPNDALLKSKVNITIPNEGNLKCKYKAPNYTVGEDNTTTKYLYYSFDRQSVEDDVLIFIKPNSTTFGYDIYMKYDTNPTQFDKNYTTNVDKSSWTIDGFRVIIRARYLPLMGKVYLGFVPRLDNSTYLDVNNEDPRVSPVCLFVSSVHCRNWDGSNWISQACKVSEESSLRYTMCMCETNGWNLITGTTFYFPVNFQTFEPIYEKPFFSGTSRVLITLATFSSLYLILLIWACWSDLFENNPWQITFLSDTDETHSYFYLLRIYTGIGPMKGTTANICFKLVGELKTTGVRTLCDEFRKSHESGSVRSYVMGVRKPLGTLTFLHIWHDHSGEDNNSWFLRKILVDDLHTGERTVFSCNKWLSLQREDGEIERKFIASSEKDVNSIGYRLSTNISHYLAYVYIWSSLFVRMHPSKISRGGRVTQAFAMVISLMFTNLLISDADITVAKDDLILGPFRFSEKNIYSALISLFITVPILYFLFAVLYKSNVDITRFLPCRRVLEKIKKMFHNHVQTDYQIKSNYNINENIILKRTELSAFIGIITWMLLFCILLASFVYTVYAATRMSVLEAETWLTSYVIAFFISILIFEIVMVLLVAILTTICGSLCDPSKAVTNVKELWVYCKRTYGILQKGPVKAKIPPCLLPKTQKATTKLRRKLILKSQTRLLITEMISYFIFLVAVYVITLSSSDNRAYKLKDSIGSGLNFTKLDRDTDLFDWMNTSFFDFYFPAKMFGVQNISYELKYHCIDFANIRVGPARLRQVRVAKETCRLRLFGEEKACYGEYQLTNEDTTHYFIGWEDGRNKIEQVDQYTFTAWHHVSALDVWGLPTTGDYNKNIYGGGGYIVKLDVNRDVSEKIIIELKNGKWIDRGTRAVFLEFTLYNSNVNLFSFVKYVIEYPEVGGVLTYSYISTFRLYYDKDLYIICSFIFLLFVVLLFYKICYDLYMDGRYYFNSLWNITDFIMLPLGIVSIGILFFRQSITKSTIEKYHNDQNEYVNFEQLAFANTLLIALLAILMYYATLRMIRIQGRSKWFDRVLRVFEKAKWNLAGFFFIFVIIFLSFISFGYFVFGKMVSNYKDPFVALTTLAQAVLGQNNSYKEITRTSVLADFFYAAFIFLVQFCLLTMATAILNASITLVHSKGTNYEMKGLDDIIFKLFAKFIAWLRRRNATRLK